MRPLTQAAQQALSGIAQRYGLSVDAVTSMLHAVAYGGGSMAQFNIPELGGGGQWMQGGMTMVGDMFNHGLQATVSNLCSELSGLLCNQNVYEPLPPSQMGGPGQFGDFASSWWPSELGQPSSSGGQNDSRYAYFPHVQRLAVDRGGQVSVYDALDHSIGGVQQQQGGPSGSLSFSSQYGTFTVESLPIVSGPGSQQAFAPPPQQQPPPQPPQQGFDPAPQQGSPVSQGEVLSALERLGDLFHKGVLTEAEFQQKKSDLLSRL